MIRNYRLPGRSELFWTLVGVRYMSILVTVVAFAHGVAEGAREAFLPDDISPFCGRGDKVLCWDCWDPAEEFKLEGVMPGNKGSRLRKCGLPMTWGPGLSHTLWVGSCANASLHRDVRPACYCNVASPQNAARPVAGSLGIVSFLQEALIKCCLCARHPAWCWANRDDSDTGLASRSSV